MNRDPGNGAGIEARRDEVLAAIDLGTNNCRLLIARPSGTGFRVIDAYSRIVRLGEGISESGLLREEAIGRTMEALGVCVEKMARRSVTRHRAIATEACRRARNCNEFLARVEGEIGLSVEIISSAEEADLALYSCAPLLSPEVPQALIFDIGGGSTEISWLELGEAPARDGLALIDGARRRAWFSTPVGVVTLAEAFAGAKAQARGYPQMVAEVREVLSDFERAHGIAEHAAAGRMQMVGTSGTVTTLAGVHMGLPRYNRAAVDGCYLERGTILDLSRQIAAMSYDERASSPCIGSERADLVVAGCAILEAICSLWPVERVRVADRGLREGILYGLLDQRRGRQSGLPSADAAAGEVRA